MSPRCNPLLRPLCPIARLVMTLVGFALAGATLGGCVTVKPWQKGDLAKPPLAKGQSDLAEARFAQHSRGAREGAEGGTGEAGGGCGCN